MPHVKRQRTAPACPLRRPGGLADDKAVDRHGVLSEPDRGDAKTQLARDPEAHAEEKPPDVRHRDPFLRARMRGQPVAQRQEAAEQLGSRATHDETDVGLRSGLRGEAPAPCQALAAAPDADRFVVARATRGIGQHAPGRVEDLARA
jgi:hypothetical protein